MHEALRGHGVIVSEAIGNLRVHVSEAELAQVAEQLIAHVGLKRTKVDAAACGRFPC